MDDNIIEHYSNHSAFLIEISEVMSGQFQVTLMELWREGADIFDVRPTPLQSVANQTACRFQLFKHYSVKDSIG